MTGLWEDLNWLGFQIPAPSPTISSALRLVTTPLVFSKFFCPVSLFILGLCVWFCFRQWKLSQLASVLGGFAAALSSHFFSTACWGVASQVIAVGMCFVALGLVADASPHHRWLKVVLAGMAVGMCVMEGYDIGAIFSLFVAVFVLYQALIGEGALRQKMGRGFVRVAIVAVFAGFLATQAVSALINTQIKGIAATEQNSEAKERNWSFCTQWSFPPAELPQIIISGLFGYRMDTSKDMACFQDAFDGGAYWGAIGRPEQLDKALQDYYASGRQGSPPRGDFRFSGGGEYASILVVLIALWAVVQSLRKKDSPFNLKQRKFIWFWTVAAFVSLLLSFGRYAPFYRVFYMLPFASTIRNATKFTHSFHLSLVILFAYGVHGMSSRYLDAAAPALTGLSAHLKLWWAKANPFDKRWTRGCIFAIVASFLAWLLYASSRGGLEKQLHETGFSDPNQAAQIASFSVHTLGWFVPLLALVVFFLTILISGWFAGPRAKLGAFLLGSLLVLDLARADLPWIIYWNYPQKYASNPVIDLLREKPYEHRVAILPLERMLRLDQLPPSARPFVESYIALYNLYHVEWKQQHFQYYNIPCLDVVQMPRKPEDLETFEKVVTPAPVRNWELTSTRYLLAPTGALELLNQQLDPVHKRFRVAAQFDIVPKPGAMNTGDLEQLTAAINTNGQLALIEFTGALPRAKLYANWQTSTNDQHTLEQLPSTSFDPAQTVMVANPLPEPPKTNSTNQPAGSVDFVSYAPKRIVLHAKAESPSVLLLNDKFDPNWKVSVDGKPDTVLRCNYIMRGVQVPAGDHQIEFRFEPPVTALYVSLSAIVLGLGLIGFLAFSPAPKGPVSSTLPPPTKTKALATR